MPNSSIKQTNSRYTQGGVTDIYSNRLGWWEREIIPKGADDETIVITGEYVRRPDILANDLYGQANLMWIILQYNTILDINTEFTDGKKIVVPAPERVIYDLISSTPDGNIIT